MVGVPLVRRRIQRRRPPPVRPVHPLLEPPPPPPVAPLAARRAVRRVHGLRPRLRVPVGPTVPPHPPPRPRAVGRVDRLRRPVRRDARRARRRGPGVPPPTRDRDGDGTRGGDVGIARDRARRRDRGTLVVARVRDVELRRERPRGGALGGVRAPRGDLPRGVHAGVRGGGGAEDIRSQGGERKEGTRWARIVRRFLRCMSRRRRCCIVASVACSTAAGRMSAPTSKYFSSPAHLLYLFPRRLTKQFAADPQRRVLRLHGLRGRAELRPRPPRRRRARRHVPTPPGRTPVPPEYRRA